MVGRLDDGKNQKMAIECFSKIANKYKDWTLEFYGDGIAYLELKKIIQNYNLDKQVFLKGNTKEVFKELLNSDIFIFPSKFEGWGMALTEAMSMGLPCIGLKSCSGVNQLIKDSINGYLVSDISEMKERLEQLMLDEDLRKKLGKSGHKSMKQYSVELMLSRWTNFIESFDEN